MAQRTRRQGRSRLYAGVVALSVALLSAGCSSPPSATLDLPTAPASAPAENPWDPLPTIDESSLQPWIQEFLPLPAGRPYGKTEITDLLFKGEWDLASVGTGEASQFATGLTLRGWNEVSDEASGNSRSFTLVSPDGLTELLISSTELGAQDRLKITAERKEIAPA